MDIDRLPAVVTNMQPWRKGTEQEKQKGLNICPRQSRKDSSLEYEAARLLLSNPKRYESALTYFSLDSLQK